MKIINISVALMLVILFLGCYKSSGPDRTPQEVCERFIKFSTARDFDGIKSLIHPDLLVYFRERGKERYPELFVYSIVASIPEGVKAVAITRLKVMSRDEIARSYEDRYFYELVPDAFKDLVEVKFAFRLSDGNEGSVAIFMKKHERSFYIVVPDLSDTSVWKQHL